MLFNRRSEVLVAGLQIADPPYLMEFEINFDTDPEPNDGEITLYNLSNDTISRIKKGQSVIMNAGYEGDTGTIALGTIDKVTTERNELDRLLKLKIGDATEQWASKTVNKAFMAGIRASQIIPDLLGIFGLEIGVFSLPNDIQYAGGKTVCGPLQTVIRQISKDCGAKFHISNGRVFIGPEKQGVQTGFVLSPDTGLIGSPEPIESDEGIEYRVRSLLNHRISADSIIKLESRDVKGWFRVVKGKHSGTKSEFITEMEVAAV